MRNLFNYLKTNDKTSLLIKACIFHYELEFIHPFSDGNGRMGRLWQQVILMKFHPIFEYLPIEALIKENQEQYYTVLGQCDSAEESTVFVEFMLQLIHQALLQYQNSITYIANTPEARIAFARKHFNQTWFSHQDYMRLLKIISPATASRDLKYAYKQALLDREGNKRITKYRFHSFNLNS